MKLGVIPLDLVNTSNCRKAAMRLRRAMESGSVKFPQCQKLFESNNADRLSLLRQFLTSEENLQKLEIQLELERENEQENEEVDKLLTLDGMRKAGVSEQLGSNYF